MRVDCENEDQVLAAIRAGQWTAALQRHAAECQVCAEHKLVAEFLREEGEMARWVAPLPDASFIWWKAQLTLKKQAMRRAARPVQVVQWLACLVGGVGLLWLLAGGGAQGWIGDRLGVVGRLSNGIGSPYALAGA